VTPRQRLIVAGLAVGGIAVGLILVAFAANACPTDAPGQPCPDAVRNRAVVVVLASLCVGLLVAPFAFLADFALHRRIVYRGAWWRAGRRAVLAALVVGVLAALRLGGALTVPVLIFIVLLAVVVERFVSSRGA
jgi:hypothetical protein